MANMTDVSSLTRQPKLEQLAPMAKAVQSATTPVVGEENLRQTGDDKSVQPIDKRRVKAGIDELNRQMAQLGTRISFNTDEDSGHLVIKVLDNESNKVIKQIPAEEILKMFAHMAEVVGLLVDKRV